MTVTQCLFPQKQTSVEAPSSEGCHHNGSNDFVSCSLAILSDSQLEERTKKYVIVTSSSRTLEASSLVLLFLYAVLFLEDVP